jgi:hypothetical protein
VCDDKEHFMRLNTSYHSQHTLTRQAHCSKALQCVPT